ncbi:MAG: LysR substrate-binding domain-containing protein, partial [Mycobacterium sp.]
WRTFWLAADSRQGTPVQLGAEVSTVDECFEAILAERGMAFSQASTQRFYDRPGLAFIPVTDIPPTMLSTAWRTDVDSPAVHDFVETARAVASLSPIPDAWIPSRFSNGSTASAKPGASQPLSPLRRVQ